MSVQEETNESHVYEIGNSASRGGLGAIILIVIGTIFLLNNFGYLSWAVWNYLLKSWPVLLIIVGLQMLAGRSRAMNLLLSIIIVAALTFLLLYLISSNNPGFDKHFNLPLPTFR